MSDKMTREEAIRRFYPAMFPHSLTFSDDDNKALEVLLSTTKLVEKAVDIWKRAIESLEKPPIALNDFYRGQLLIYKEALTLLTEEFATKKPYIETEGIDWKED